MRPLLASDLDRTLIHPMRTVPEDQADAIRPIERYDGRQITGAAPETLELLARLSAAGAFAPVTTRSLAQLQRIEPIWALAERGWAVCANGATVLHQGAPDSGWEAERARRTAGSHPVGEARAIVEREIGSPERVDWMPLLRACDDHFLYATLDLATIPPELEAHADAVMRPLGWRAVQHLRKLYLMPAGLCKAAATEYVAARTGADFVMAAGDSMLDLELLDLAERSWCPADAELIEQAAELPGHTVVTGAVHAAAGAEIARCAVQHAVERGWSPA